MKRHSLLALLLATATLPSLSAAVQHDTRELVIRFDKPTSLQGCEIWHDGFPERGSDGRKPISAGDAIRNPDPEWESQSLPLGNGSIGANILGSVSAERITFNEKTLWRGGPGTKAGAAAYWHANKESAAVLSEIRQAFADGDTEKAARLTRTNFNGLLPYESTAEEPFRFGSFTTMGEFRIDTGLDSTAVSDYRRTLSLDDAIAAVRFCSNGTTYERSCFISYPANVLVVRFSADRKGAQHLTLKYAPNPVATGEMMRDGDNGLLYTARLDNNAMQYAIRIRAAAAGGRLSNDGGVLRIDGADEVVFYITADTDYAVNFNPDFDDPRAYVGVDPLATTHRWAAQAEKRGYEALKKEHIRDYSELFGRVSLSLNPRSAQRNAHLSTPERLRRYRAGAEDYALEELYYQFGRYLLIASSRAGNLPANLQGVWHNNVDGPWRVDYHNNINLQMNYWPACPTQLGECVLPLVDFIRTLIKPGERTARAYFGARGWTASVSGNIFGFTSPLSSEDMSWNFSPMAGPWLATHIWEYYDYTRDERFLREVGYELLRSSARFTVDYLWRRDDGSYTAAPSTSPEHGPVDEGATFVHAVVREILADAIAASEVLGVDQKERRAWHEVLERLAPYRIGRYGQLMEWSQDIDDPQSRHRHVNHLFGLHPGHTISPVTTPELARASRVVLEHRGDGATGWSMGWKLNQWARLHDGNRAYKLFGNLLREGTLDNLWDTHPPFQIDGNFGGTAGMTEMLLQSHTGEIHLLPALPQSWNEGHVSGLCSRGNFVVDIEWSGGQLKRTTILSRAGVSCRIRYADTELSFDTTQGRKYEIRNNGGRLSLRKL